MEVLIIWLEAYKRSIKRVGIDLGAWVQMYPVRLPMGTTAKQADCQSKDPDNDKEDEPEGLYKDLEFDEPQEGDTEPEYAEEEETIMAPSHTTREKMFDQFRQEAREGRQTWRKREGLGHKHRSRFHLCQSKCDKGFLYPTASTLSQMLYGLYEPYKENEREIQLFDLSPEPQYKSTDPVYPLNLIQLRSNVRDQDDIVEWFHSNWTNSPELNSLPQEPDPFGREREVKVTSEKGLVYQWLNKTFKWRPVFDWDWFMVPERMAGNLDAVYELLKVLEGKLKRREDAVKKREDAMKQQEEKVKQQYKEQGQVRETQDQTSGVLNQQKEKLNRRKEDLGQQEGALNQVEDAQTRLEEDLKKQEDDLNQEKEELHKAQAKHFRREQEEVRRRQHERERAEGLREISIQTESARQIRDLDEREPAKYIVELHAAKQQRIRGIEEGVLMRKEWTKKTEWIGARSNEEDETAAVTPAAVGLTAPVNLNARGSPTDPTAPVIPNPGPSFVGPDAPANPNAFVDLNALPNPKVGGGPNQPGEKGPSKRENPPQQPSRV
ncbi:hypothetical protein GQ43DRAFT_468343 [Delitschia confertaspora ATCC 74209]|uniref:Uncharacterized protein n=1 Tax=Delitschia confertaspora ATCC 74209 TaxID=1513339 RepID=A0A9P4JXZ9_9PLEO|nr:hypothetical protein GQ43DRAFT_468343 [Delitschia confertaspora ATCC 74209]